MRNNFVEKAVAKLEHTFDYSRVLYVNAITEVEIICRKHGSYLQKPSAHLNNKHPCKQCYEDEKIKKFIETATLAHNGEYNYSLVPSTFKGAREKCTIICKIHGEFPQSPDLHSRGRGCPDCGRISTTAKLTRSKENFVKEAEEKHDKKFDYSESDYIDTKTDIIIRCAVHDHKFKQTPSKHISSKHCCPECLSENKDLKCTSQEEYIERVEKVHDGKYDYSKTIYVSSESIITITCKIHGDFELKATYHSQGTGCRKCSNSI